MPNREDRQTDAESQRVLWLSGQMRDEIVRHLRAALPWEGCGLIGAEIDGNVVIARRFYPGENADRSPTRFTMEPAQVIAAFKSMRETGLELGAIVHSHPRSAAEPSPTDQREAYYPDALNLIVSFRESEPELRVWEWLSGEWPMAFRETGVAIDDLDDPACLAV